MSYGHGRRGLMPLAWRDRKCEKWQADSGRCSTSSILTVSRSSSYTSILPRWPLSAGQVAIEQSSADVAVVEQARVEIVTEVLSE